MGRLTEHIAGRPGHFCEGEDDKFPWERTDGAIWYALMVVESGKIECYGFTSSKSNKTGLLQALTSLPQDDEALLLGVWTGEYRTELFVLDKDTAIQKLQQLDYIAIATLNLTPAGPGR